MNPNNINNNFSAEYDKNSRESLESFINPENYIDYFDNKMPLTLDAEYNDENSYDEVDKLVNVFNRLESESTCNKDTFNNLLNLSYCRAAQFSTFNYADINPFSVLILDTVSDIKSDSKFVNRLIEEIEFNEYENTPKYYQSISIDNPRLKFIKNYINFGPDHRGLYKSTIEHDINENYDGLLGDNAYRRIGLSGNETLNSHYVELEVLGLFGVAMADIKEEVRDLLFDWGVNLTNEEYDKLKDISKSKSLDHRIEMANAFIATEFGRDFGDSILDIAENAKPNESREIFKLINEYRKISKVFSGQFDDIDLKFSSGTERAMNERLTDLLAVAAEVAKNGRAVVDTAPNRDNKDYEHDGKFDIKIDSLGQIIETMNLFLNSQKIMSDILSSDETCLIERYKKSDNKFGSQTYLLMNDNFGIAQFHVRQFGAGSFDRVIEHGNYNGTEATISWSVNPNNPFSYPGLKDPDCMNVRFDREGRSIDEAPDSPDRSPIRDDGIISLDIGSVLGEKTSASTVIGRTIAAGNILRSENKDNNGIDISLNHNTNYLPQLYGNANDFAWLAMMMERKVINKYEHANNKNIRKIAKSLIEKSVDISGLAS